MNNPERSPSRLASALAAFIGGAGVMHFLAPRFFDEIVPSWMPGSPRTTTYVSGVAEIASGVLVAVPRTRRLGGLVAALTFVGVFPANVQSVLDGGIASAPEPFNSPVAAWLRLPLQIPMIAWALRVRRDAP